MQALPEETSLRSSTLLVYVCFSWLFASADNLDPLALLPNTPLPTLPCLSVSLSLFFLRLPSSSLSSLSHFSLAVISPLSLSPLPHCPSPLHVCPSRSFSLYCFMTLLSSSCQCFFPFCLPCPAPAESDLSETGRCAHLLPASGSHV